MSPLHDDSEAFAEDALRGFVDAHADTVRAVPGGVVRRVPTRPGKVAVVVGGGSGHYPAFSGLVGEGMADGAVVGNVFTSPSVADAAQVARERSEEHTSELQSRGHLVCRLLLEKKKKSRYNE